MAHRVLQAFDTAQFVKMTSGCADAIILAGDLNTEPQDLAYRIIRGIAGLTDACPNSESHIGTNECANNSYTNSKLARARPDGKRIDYILYLNSDAVKVSELYDVSILIRLADVHCTIILRLRVFHCSFHDL